MSKHDELPIDQQQLTEAWQRTLPDAMKERDRAIVVPDEGDSKALRITINTAGHQDV